MYENIKQVGLPPWTDADQRLARALQKELGVADSGLAVKLDTLRPALKPEERRGGGSDDIGDVSWNVPTVTLRFPSNIPGLPGHNWANAISMATPIAHKGATAGAKVMATTLLDLLLRPELVSQAWDYFRNVQTKDIKYQPLIRPQDRPAIELNRDIMARYRPEMRACTTIHPNTPRISSNLASPIRRSAQPTAAAPAARRPDEGIAMDKKKFLFVSLDGLIADIAWQVVKEGHEVKLYTDNKEEREIGDGFVPKTDNWAADVPWADVIVFDDVLGQGAKAQQLRQTGKLVVGGTPYTDMLEDDRAFGQQELKKAGVPIIPQENFHSFDDALAFVRANPHRYVIKPSGEAQNIKQLLFVGEDEDGKDVIQVLEDYSAPGPTASKRSSCSAASSAWKSRPAASSTARSCAARQHQLRAQEALSRRHRPLHRRDGHDDVLERADAHLQRDAQEDGAAAP
jgi:hypothetical protein